MVVLDASALLRLLLKPEDDGELPRQEIHVPHLCDAEVAHTLRRLCLHGVVDAPRARILIQALEDGDWERHPHFPYLERVWELRHNHCRARAPARLCRARTRRAVERRPGARRAQGGASGLSLEVGPRRFVCRERAARWNSAALRADFARSANGATPAISAYDALYVALAEGLACPLLTFDRRLADAARRFARVELL